MRNVIIGLLVLALVALGAWFGLRALIDAERHEESLRAALESATGWSASFGGIDVSFARGLKLEMRELKLVDRRGGSSIEAPRAIFRAELSGLLRGELVLSDVALLRPAIVIARDPARGWRWPQPGRAAPDTPELSELTIKGGRLSLTGPAVSRTLELEEISAVLTPATGRLWGTALFAEGSGRAKWLGRIGEGVEITVEGAEARVLASWLPPDARPTGVVDLALRTDSRGTRCEGRLDANELTIFPEQDALRDVGVEFSVVADEGAWRLDAVQIEASGVEARAEGWLAPFDARVIVEDAPLGAALEASRALARWGEPRLEDQGGGRLAVTLHLGGEGPRRWWWSGLSVEGARIARGEEGPVLRDAALQLDRVRRDDEITGRVRGTLAGGSLVATLRVPGSERIEIEGGLRGARASALTGAGGRGARLTLEGRATLMRGAPSAASLVAGELRLSGQGWAEPGWELSPRLVEACPPEPPPEERPADPVEARAEAPPDEEESEEIEPPPPPPPPDPPAGLPLSWAARLDLSRGALRELRAEGEAWILEGEGTYAAASRALDLELVLQPRAAARELFRAACGRGLAPEDPGPWPLGLVVRGTLTDPSFSSREGGEVRAEDEPLQSKP